ncbi:Signal transduction histidine kinase [Dethiosulfatibacter aminovorans DSM 17477]|uniref:histidine kinase n=1 Tax=Dethiosulfatibacter aminovorans DSM 17477 TaxID=1121476 RepID=A0A1M6GNQ6_9FIRM|nr:HAMP domain-containing sensor histidine kinase [Dethiosulfatibacter aminovorans]SHJ11579.1 Signal transduction histidine kinase [Dethiosulfatibacter aminovorans DSM 17477]
MKESRLRKIIKEILLNRIVFAIAGAAIIGIFAFMLYGSFAESREINTENEKENLLNQLYYVSEAINYYFYDMRNDLELLSSTIFEDEENAVVSLRNFSFRQQVTVKSVTLMDNFNDVLYDEYNTSSELFNEEIYDKIMRDGKKYMRNIIIPAETATKIDIYLVNDNEYVISFGVKSVPQDGKQRILIITVSLNDIYDRVISPQQIPVESHPTLKDQYGDILLHSNPDFIGMNSIRDNVDTHVELEGSEFQKVLRDQLTAKSDARVYTSVYEEDGKIIERKMISAYMPVYFLDDYWIISMTFDIDDDFNQIMAINNRIMLFAFLLTMAFAMLLSAIYYLARNKLRLESEANQLRRFNSALEELHNKEALLTRNTKYRTMGYMTMGIVHELNNLLTPVIGLTDLLKEEIEDEGQAVVTLEEINVINESAVHSQELIQQVLLVGRQDKTYSAFRDVDLKDALEKSIKVVGVSFSKKITIIKKIEDLPMFVYGNRSQLVQVFVNIAINGIHAMDEGGILKVSLRQVEGVKDRPDTRMKDRCIEVKIKDNGCGIEEKDLKNIFLPFYTTKTEGDGTGLGLSVVADIIKNHKGEIYVDSKVGEGTSFYVYLPLLNMDDVRLSINKEASDDKTENGKICIVNVRKDMAESLEKALIKYDVSVYLDQATYAAMVSSGRIEPDILVVSDNDLTVDGIQLINLTKRAYPETKILYIADGMRKEPGSETMEIIDVYITGPVSYSEIIESIKELI